MNEAPKPGIYEGIDNDAYHAGPGVSRSTLWKFSEHSPARARYGEQKSSAALTMGSAVDDAIFDPDRFDSDYARGPEANKNTKIWKSAVEEAEAAGVTLLSNADMDMALALRDAVWANPTAARVLNPSKTLVQRSAYWVDQETGLLCKVRPDAARPDLNLLVDLKSAADASPWTWGKRAADFGYHAQDWFYSHGWTQAGGGQIDGMLFIVVEKEPPYLVALYEFEPQAVAEGAAAMRRFMNLYAEYSALEAQYIAQGEDGRRAWPGYPAEVQAIDLPKFAYRFTEPAGDRFDVSVA